MRKKLFDDCYMPEPNTGCWLWVSYTNDMGYGQTRHMGQTYYAHRLSYEKSVGPIPHGMHVCHRCDTPSCVNPDHLFLGTRHDNMRDMSLKRRHVGNRKLTVAQVLEIRESKEPGFRIADRFGVNRSTVYAVRRGVNWASVEPDPDAGLEAQEAYRNLFGSN